MHVRTDGQKISGWSIDEMPGCDFCDNFWSYVNMVEAGCDPDLPDYLFSSNLKTYMRKLYVHQNEVHGANHVISGNKKGANGAHKGEWAFTLTMSPDDGYTEDDLVSAAMKLMSQQSCPVKRYAWYLEHKEDEKHPHIHGIYETDTGGRIEAKHFKRAWPIWNEKQKLGRGFRGGYHRPVLSPDEYLGYISKDRHKAKGKFDFKGYIII